MAELIKVERVYAQMIQRSVAKYIGANSFEGSVEIFNTTNLLLKYGDSIPYLKSKLGDRFNDHIIALHRLLENSQKIMIFLKAIEKKSVDELGTKKIEEIIAKHSFKTMDKEKALRLFTLLLDRTDVVNHTISQTMINEYSPTKIKTFDDKQPYLREGV